jgi:hypothetical protein
MLRPPLEQGMLSVLEEEKSAPPDRRNPPFAKSAKDGHPQDHFLSETWVEWRAMASELREQGDPVTMKAAAIEKGHVIGRIALRIRGARK